MHIRKVNGGENSPAELLEKAQELSHETCFLDNSIAKHPEQGKENEASTPHIGRVDTNPKKQGGSHTRVESDFS